MPKLQEFEKVKTVEDHFELIRGISECGQDILTESESKSSEKLEKEFILMTNMLVKNLRLKLKYVLKESAKYRKKPSLLERIKDMQREREERKEEREERRRLKDEGYQAYLEWLEAQEEEQSEAETEEEQSSLPAVWEPRTPQEVFEGEQTEEEEDETEEE